MAGGKVIVYFEDGTEGSFNPNRPRLLLDLEDTFGVQAPETQAQFFWMAHRALAPEIPFDKWIDTIEDCESVEAPGAPPGKAVPSSTG